MSKNITQLIHDISLLEFYETRNNKLVIISNEEITNLCRKHRQFRCNVLEEDTAYIHRNIINIKHKTKISYIREILDIGDGKIVLCGFSLIDIIKDVIDIYCPYEFYFHSCDILEAQELLRNCILLLLNSYGDLKLTYDLAKNTIIIDAYLVNISFCCTVYNNKQEIMFSLPSVLRHYYCPIEGYVTTVPAATSLIIGANLINSILTPQQIYKCSVSKIATIANSSYSCLPEYSTSDEGCYSPIYNFNADIIGTNYYDRKDETLPITIEQVLPYFSIYKDSPYKKTNQKDCLDKNYSSITVGICNDQYVAFCNCRNKFNLGQDIFRLLCSYWFNAEVSDAKRRVLQGY